MAEYIKKFAVVDKLTELQNELQQYKPFRPCEAVMYRKVCEVEIEIGKMESADVAPVVHGRWDRDEWGSHLRICSACKNPPVYTDERGNGVAVYACICINCGARMDKEADHE